MPAVVWLGSPASVARVRLDLLDRRERDRRDRLAMPGDRDRFTVAAVLLRLLAARQLAVDPGAVEVDRTCATCGEPHGRPALPGTGWHASISHSAGLVAVAVSADAPIGVDVEQRAPRDTGGLGRAVLGPGERAADAHAFYTYWCRKEAVVKATGEGLRVPLVEVTVSGPGERARLLGYRGAPLACAMADLSLPSEFAGYAGAVAVLTGGPLEVAVLHPDERVLAATG